MEHVGSIVKSARCVGAYLGRHFKIPLQKHMIRFGQNHKQQVGKYASKITMISKSSAEFTWRHGKNYVI
jgi:hypothetical protein